MGHLIILCIRLQLLLLLHALCNYNTVCQLPAAATLVNSSSLELLSVGTLFDLSAGAVATPTLDAGGLFFPILSSPSFISSNSSTPPYPGFGFSLGFYILPIRYVSGYPPCEIVLAGCNIYLALCAGSLGHTNNGSNTSSLSRASSTLDGLVAPLWLANLNSPIHHADKASLVVEHMQAPHAKGMLELQLRDGENTVWRVGNVGVMEIDDAGRLVIYDSQNKTHLVWPSLHETNTDTLIEGQILTVGHELVSNDSTYVARMEKGGLALYMNKSHFNWELQPPPYWVFPVFRDDHKALHFDINQLIGTAPCTCSTRSPGASLRVMRHGLSPYGSNYFPLLYHYIVLDSGSCSSRKSFIQFSEKYVRYNLSWSFMRLENDGKLYSYAVSNPKYRDAAAYVTRIALDSADGFHVDNITTYSFMPPFLKWQECNAPMACGPLGVCTPGAKTVCTCLESHFKSVNSKDLSQGCDRLTPLPPCGGGNEHTNSTDFVDIESTASILLFSGWMPYNSAVKDAQVDACKQLCSANCSCKGFFYQVDTSLCYFIHDEISLLTVSDKTLYSVNYTSEYNQDPATLQRISAKNYVTYLKITSVLNTTKKHKMILLPSPVPLIVPTFVLSLVLGVAIYCFRERQKRSIYKSRLAKEKEELKDILPLLPNKFSFKELHEATQGFSKLLGTGGCGSVYAGVLSDGRKVAVKVLQFVLQGAGQSKQFLAELAAAGRTGHHNIVRLLGFCWEDTHRLLVYEYVERGSLDRWIFVKQSMPLIDETSAVAAPALLDWKTRYNVATGIARGLSYLHEDCEQPILHFDIKPQNILLGDDFEAKLADFGMSRLMQRDMTSVVTGVRGTPGYVAPEWYSHGTVSKKCDVYSMGMVLLEIVGGRKNLDFTLLNSSNIDPEEQEAWHFPTWAAKKCDQGLVMELVDKRLYACGFDAEQARRLIYTAFWCTHDDPAMRPYAPTVVQWLESHSPIKQPPFSTLGLNARSSCPPTTFSSSTV